MITRLNLKNFKCFNELSLPLSSLSFFTGFNAGGKSSAYQSLLLLTQSLQSNQLQSASLILNGKLVRLGTPAEVLYDKATKKEIVIGVQRNNHNFEAIINLKEEKYGQALQISEVNLIRENKEVERIFLENEKYSLNSFFSMESLFEVANFLSDIIYISAVRGGPLDVYPSPDTPDPINAEVGKQGEYAPWWFYQKLDENIDQKRRHSSEKALTLRRQFNAWASELFPGAQGHVISVEKTNLMRLQLRISDLDDWRRPANIGYGLSYAFPVLVAGLLAKEGQILVIDSPEAHLHPLGQSRMGFFLAKIAAAGVQIITETHSDHVLNGVRLALLEEAVKPKDICLHFFYPPSVSANQEQPQIISPQVDQQGNLSEWPEGFFDQAERDLARLAGWE